MVRLQLLGATYGRTVPDSFPRQRHWTILPRLWDLLPISRTVELDPADTVTQTVERNALSCPTAKWIRGKAPNGKETDA